MRSSKLDESASKSSSNSAVADRPVALVTGASSGIGRATALHLASEGFQVFGTSRQERADPEGVTMLALDVRSDESVASCVETLLSGTGRIDLLVSNAGTTHLSTAEETDPDMAERVMDTNFWVQCA